jgi:hypothetical protein
MGLSNYWLLKPKEDPVVRNHRTGPQQRCSIGCKTSASAAKLDEVASLFFTFLYKVELLESHSRIVFKCLIHHAILTSTGNMLTKLFSFF